MINTTDKNSQHNYTNFFGFDVLFQSQLYLRINWKCHLQVDR